MYTHFVRLDTYKIKSFNKITDMIINSQTF